MTIASNPFRVEITPPAGAMPAWRTGAELLTWFEIPGTTLRDQAAALGLTSTEAGNLTAFSSGAWDGTDFYIHGGGHSDFAGNGIYRLRLSTDTPTFSVTVAARARGTRDAATTDDGYYYPIVGGVAEPVEIHSYWMCAVDAGRFFRFGSGGVGAALDGRGTTVDAADIAAGTWDGKGVYPPLPVQESSLDGYSSTTDDQRRKWFTLALSGAGRLQMFDFTTLAFTDFGILTGSSSGDTCLTYDPVRKRLFRPRTGFVSTTAQTFDIGDSWDGVSAPAVTSRTLTAGAGVDLTTLRKYCQYEYCADRDSFLIMKWNDTTVTVYEMGAESFRIEVLAVLGVPPVVAAAGGKGYYHYRWKYVDALGGIFFMPSAASNCFFIGTR